MYQVGPFIVKNLHFKKCLEFRKARKYPEALAALEEACFEEDEEAMWFKKTIEDYGGLGVNKKRNFIQYRFENQRNIEPLITQGSIEATREIFLSRYRIAFTPLIENFLNDACVWNDPFTLFYKQKFKLCLEQKFETTLVYNHLIQEYIFKKKHLKSTRLLVSNVLDERTIYDHIKCRITYGLVKEDRLKCYFLFGRWLNTRSTNKYPKFAICLRIYQDTLERVSSAIRAWMMTSKRLGFYKDLSRKLD